MRKHIAISTTPSISFETIKNQLYEYLRKKTLTPSDHAKITQWLTDYPTLVTTTGPYGWAPLHLAAEFGKQNIVETLLQHSAKIEAQTKLGSTPLHVAARYGQQLIIETLLKHGADKDAQTNEDATPLHLAAATGHPHILETLINAGANKDAQTKDGWTPLHLAAKYGKQHILETLINAGADKEAQTNQGATPLHIAKDELKTVPDPEKKPYLTIIQALEKADKKDPPHPLQPAQGPDQQALITAQFDRISVLSQQVFAEKKINAALQEDIDRLRTQLKRDQPDNPSPDLPAAKKPRLTPRHEKILP